MLCIYHRTDFDGKCAGAIVKRAYPECRLYPLDYADNFDVDRIKENEEVIMVDFTLEKPGQMESLVQKCGQFIWIDHHKTVVPVEQRLKEKGFFDQLGPRKVSINPDDPNGIFSRNRISGCELTWNYFFHDQKMPYSVFLLGRYDVWDDKNPLWKTEIIPFQYGMRRFNGEPSDQEFWEPHFSSDDTSSIIRDMISYGKIIFEYEMSFSEKVAKGLWFPIEFEGLKFQAINRPLANSLSGEFIWDPTKYDALMYFTKGPHMWRITMFTDKPGIDLFPIAVKHGGGGHSQACGFTTTKIMDVMPQLIEF